MNYALDYKGRCILLGDLLFCQGTRDSLIADGRSETDFVIRLASPTDIPNIPEELRSKKVEA